MSWVVIVEIIYGKVRFRPADDVGEVLETETVHPVPDFVNSVEKLERDLSRSRTDFLYMYDRVQRLETELNDSEPK